MQAPGDEIGSGMKAAAAVAAAYGAATALGVVLGAWSAGWDRCAASCLQCFVFEAFLGFKSLLGVIAILALGVLSWTYVHLRVWPWDLLNGISFFWCLYFYGSFGAGEACYFAYVTRPAPVPGWRIYASIGLIVAIWALGRVTTRARFRRVRAES